MARRKNKIEELAATLEEEKGKLFAYQADMTEEEDILQAFEWIKENFGPIHVLVNNAGGMNSTTLIDGDTALWKRTFDLNVLGVCIATREAIKDMRENEVDGYIININSTLGHEVPVGSFFNVYPASKFAVTAITETLRQELISAGCKIRTTVRNFSTFFYCFAVNLTYVQWKLRVE